MKSSSDLPPSSTSGHAPRPTTSLRAVGLVSTLTGLQLAIQFGMQVVMARNFGAGRDVDAYVSAVTVPTVLGTIMSASLGYVLVPVIAEARRGGDPRAAASVATQICVGLTALSFIVMAFLAAAASPISALLCPGFTRDEIAMTASLLRVLSLLVVTICLTAYLNALYHSFGQFARPAVAGAVGTGITLIYMILFHARQGIFSIAWGVVAGSLVAVALMIPLIAAQFRLAPVSTYRVHPGTRRALSLLTPLVLGAIYWRLDPLLDRFLGSYLESGSIAHMGYSWRLVSGLMLIGTSGLSIVAFPAIAAHAASGQKESLAAEVAHAFRFFLFLMIPICVGVSVFALPVVRLLFEHGRFTSADSQAVALLVVLYAGIILGAGLGDLLSRTSYAQHDMRTPVLVSMAAFTVAALVKIIVIRPWGAAGIVAATSFYSLLNVLILGGILLNRLSPAILQGTSQTTLRAFLASAIAIAAAAALMLVPGRWMVVPAAAAGALAYCVAMRMMNDEFTIQFQRWLRRE